jgi:hypothetical protein
MSALMPAPKAEANLGPRHFPGSGSSLYERLEIHPDKQFSPHDHLRGTSEQVLVDLVRTDVLAGTRHLLDIAGGTATNAIPLVLRYPDLHITLVDLEKVVAEVAENIAAAGVADRIDVIACDVFTEPLPAVGVDTALLAHMLPIWSPEADRARRFGGLSVAHGLHVGTKRP